LSGIVAAVRDLFRFPDPVNEVSARLVAGGVVVLTTAYLLTGWLPLLVVVAYGFCARVLTGPTLSPLGQLVTRVVTPWLEARWRVQPRDVPGPPKRFAQGVGAALSLGALVAALLGSPTVAVVLVAAIMAAALLESAFAFCLGCKAFTVLMRVGVIPDSVCEACNDLSRRPGFGVPASPAPERQPAGSGA
jgi:hypothetical protein